MMSGGIIGNMGAQGSGILGNMGASSGGIFDRAMDNSSALMGLFGAMSSGDDPGQGYVAGQRQDMVRRELVQKQHQQQQLRVAAKSRAQEMGIDPQLAEASPETVLTMWQKLETDRRTPKEPRQPQIFGGADSGYYTLGPDMKPIPLVPGTGPKPPAPPSGYRQTPDGNLEAIPGGPGDKPTEGQSNAALYSQRMIESDKILSDPKVTDASQSRGDRALSKVPVWGNSMVSTEFQKAEQAQRNFINATLRRESGAVISPEEFENARLQYFPQAGDDPEVVRQKAANRKTAIQGITNAAGPARKSIQGGAAESISRGKDGSIKTPWGVLRKKGG